MNNFESSKEKTLLKILHSGFVHIRHDIAVGDLEQAVQICNLLHNIPLLIDKIGSEATLVQLREKVEGNALMKEWLNRILLSIEESI